MSPQGSWWVSQRRNVKTRKLKRDKRNVIWRTNTRLWKSATICTSNFLFLVFGIWGWDTCCLCCCIWVFFLVLMFGLGHSSRIIQAERSKRFQIGCRNLPSFQVRPKICPPKGDFCKKMCTKSLHMIQICQKHRSQMANGLRTWNFAKESMKQRHAQELEAFESLDVPWCVWCFAWRIGWKNGKQSALQVSIGTDFKESLENATGAAEYLEIDPDEGLLAS